MFPRQWTPCLFSKDLAEKPVPITVANTKIAVFRDEWGRANALVDQCPHRGARLSLGQVKGSCIECPFHGWQYDRRGDCTFVPLSGLSETERSKVHAVPLPTHENGGLVFVFTAPGLGATHSPPVIPEELGRAGVHVAFHEEIWNAHWSRAMENMLDAPHLSPPRLLHRTIGRSLRRRTRSDSAVTVCVEPTHYGFRAVATLDGVETDAWLDWLRPNGMVSQIPIPGRTYRQHVYCVPVDEEHTKMMLLTTRDFALHNPLARLADLYSLRVMAEDRRVVESIRPMAVPLAETHCARTDGATVEFRRWYWAALRSPAAIPRDLSLS